MYVVSCVCMYVSVCKGAVVMHVWRPEGMPVVCWMTLHLTPLKQSLSLNLVIPEIPLVQPLWEHSHSRSRKSQVESLTFTWAELQPQ